MNVELMFVFSDFSDGSELTEYDNDFPSKVDKVRLVLIE